MNNPNLEIIKYSFKILNFVITKIQLNTENTAKHFVRLGEVVIFCNIQERLSDFLKFEERLCDFSITLRRGCMILCNILDLIVLSSDTIVTSLYSTYIFIIIK